MKNYKMNFSTMTLTITKDFADKLLIPNSEEAQIFEHLKSICPNLKVANRTNTSKAKNPYKGLSYAKMSAYIRLFENSDELLNNFNAVIALSQIQKNKYQYVCNWFLEQFPNYTELPEIVNGKPQLSTNVISINKAAA